MAQYKAGTVSVTYLSATVTGSGTEWLTNATVGDWFYVVGESVRYEIAVINSDTEIVLDQTYKGATQTGALYTIHSDFTESLGLPLLSRGDVETAKIISRAFQTLDNGINVTGMDWKGAWDVGTTYAEDDTVFYDGSTYIALTAHSGQTPPSPASAPSAYWDLVAQTGERLVWKGEWSNTTSYIVGDVVRGFPDILNRIHSYVCIADHTNQAPPEWYLAPTAYWDLLVKGGEGFDWYGAWDSGITYYALEVVSYNGNIYFSLQDTNLNQNPETATTYWELLSRKGDTGDTGADWDQWQGAWSAGTYQILDAVEHNGSSWIATAITTEEPSLSATDWDLLAAKGTDGAGTGDVVGPAGAVNNNIVAFDGVTGKLVKDSGSSITDLHAHTNKTTLDKITESGGLPLWDGGAWPDPVIDFTDLGDTPSAYTSSAGKLLAVNSTADGVEFVDGIPAAAFADPVTLVATSGSINIDWTASWRYIQPEPTGPITYTFTAPETAARLSLLIQSDGTSTAQTITLPTVTEFGTAWAPADNLQSVLTFEYLPGVGYNFMGANEV